MVVVSYDQVPMLMGLSGTRFSVTLLPTAKGFIEGTTTWPETSRRGWFDEFSSYIDILLISTKVFKVL
jgi:hypothetical protein